jgi:hypothetical protein
MNEHLSGCEYCRYIGYIGDVCMVEEIEKKMEEEYKRCICLYGIEDGEREFKIKMLYCYNEREIKIVMKKINIGVIPDNKITCIKSIWFYYLNKLGISRVVIEENDILSWGIDRTGGNTDVIEYLIVTEGEQINKKRIDVKMNNSNNNKILDCAICYESYSEEKCVSLNCSHEFCSTCIQSVLKLSPEPSCALCRNLITKMSVKSEEIYKNLNKLI